MNDSCPHCGAELPRTRWRMMFKCAACGRSSLNPLVCDLRPAADQVRRDRSGIHALLLVLGALGVLGAFSLGAASPAFILVALLGVWGFSVWRSDRPAASHPVVKVLVGLFAAAGVVVLLGGAVLVFLFIQCATGGLRLG